MSQSTTHVLIVEDDVDIASALARGLRREGFDVTTAQDIASARAALDRGCDAAIVDSMLGDERGEDLIRDLRAEGASMPIIMLSALSDVDDRMRGLAAGADDYVAKPFEFAELLTRLQVQASRRGTPEAELEVDPLHRTVTRGAHSTTLTQREMDLLQFMLDRTGQLLSRGEIFDALWLNDGSSAENVVDVYIGYLRRKLAPTSKLGLEIKTVRGRGFVLSRQGDP